MPNTTFDRSDLSAFARLDDLGLELTGQRIWPDHAVLACRIVSEDRWYRRCESQGEARDTVVRCLAHEPYGGTLRSYMRAWADTAAQSALTCGVKT